MGPVEVRVDGVELRLAGGKQRALLSLLLLHANRVVSTERLLQDLWGDDPPDKAANALQVYIAGLRRLLEPDRSPGAMPSRLVTRDPGYLLVVGDGDLDLDRYQALVEEGRALAPTDPAAASRLLRRALGLWRGPALENVNGAPFAASRASQLEELRLGAVESAIAVDLALGRSGEVLPELYALVAAHPYLEGLRVQQMLALYRAGRQADALQVYRDTRRMLADELGLEPGPELQAMEVAVLHQDPSLAGLSPPAPGALAPAPLPGVRRRRLAGVGLAAIAVIAGVGALALTADTPTRPPPRLIRTVAGGGSAAFTPDGGLGASAFLTRPGGVAAGGDGTIYFVEGDRVRRINKQGRLETVAGSGQTGFSGDGGAATLASFNLTTFWLSPTGLALDDAGDLYVPDTYNHRVRRVSPEGIITTVAGSGPVGFSGDGGGAVDATLNAPHAVALAPDGTLFIADSENHRVRKVSPDGLITTYAGTGSAGFSGDDGPAGLAELDTPLGLCLTATGDLFIADTNNQRVREVTPSGKIVTVAGDGQLGATGDNGPARQAHLALPAALACGADGTLFVADSENNRIRAVDPTGTIRALAGSGSQGFAGDGGEASLARLNQPLGVAISVGGELLIADSGNNRIRTYWP